MRSCPFCGENSFLSIDLTDRNHNCYQVVCDYCAAVGPSAGNEEDAERYWNERGNEI